MKDTMSHTAFSHHNYWSLLILCFMIAPGAFSNDSTPSFKVGYCPLWNCGWITADTKAEWGTVSVPESRTAINGKEIELAVVILRCKSNKPAPALFILGGGPGASTVNMVRSWANSPLREKFDVVLFDQRGTGYSKPRLCPFLTDSIIAVLSKDNTLEEEVKMRIIATNACRDSLAKRSIDVSTYNSKESAADLDAIRRSLGYKKISILGISYGTRLALTYMREFPASLQNVILDSTVPLNANYFEHLPLGLERSVERLCTACSVDPSCKRKFPDLKNEIIQTINDLQNLPLTVEWQDGDKIKQFVLNGQDFVLMLQQSLYYPDILPLVPVMIHQFHQRNKALVSGFISILATSVQEFDYGVYYSVMCNETMPFNSKQQYTSLASALPIFTKGIGFFTSEFNICEAWKSTPPDSLEHNAVTSSIPTLVLAGEYDPITPPEYGKLVCRTLPNSYFVEIPLKSHAVSFTNEAIRVLAEFLDDPTHQPDTAYLKDHPPLKFITDVYITGGVFNALVSLSENRKQIYTSLILFSMVVFLLYFLVFLTYLLLKRWKTGWKKMGRNEYLILNAGCLISLLGLVYYGGIIYSINDGTQSNGFLMLFGLPGYAKVWIVISLIILILFVFSLYKGFSIFNEGLLTRFWRLMYLVLMLGCLNYIGLIISWHFY